MFGSKAKEKWKKYCEESFIIELFKDPVFMGLLAAIVIALIIYFHKKY